MPSRLTPTLRTVNPNRYRQHPLANRILPPFAGELRRCPEPGCITVLNGYNPGPYCLRHTSEDEGAYMARLDRELDRAAREHRKAGAAVSSGDRT